MRPQNWPPNSPRNDRSLDPPKDARPVAVRGSQFPWLMTPNAWLGTQIPSRKNTGKSVVGGGALI